MTNTVNFTIAGLYTNFNYTSSNFNLIKIYNILLNNPNYSYVKGLFHIDFNCNKAILFTDIDYSHIEYDVKWELMVDIVNYISGRQIECSSITYNDIKIIYIPLLLSRMIDNDIQYIEPNLSEKVGVIFDLNKFTLAYKVRHYKIANIIETIQNININTLKSDLEQSLVQFTSNIKTYTNNNLSEIIQNNFYHVIPGIVNLTTPTVKFLTYIKNNDNVIDNANDKCNEFKKLVESFFITCNNNKIRKSIYIKNTNRFSIKLEYNPRKYYNNYSLNFKFNDIKLSIKYSWNEEVIYLFIISYLMYLKSYNLVVSQLTNKIIQEL